MVNQSINVDTSNLKQNEIPLRGPLRVSENIVFLKDAYDYPPKINVKIDYFDPLLNEDSSHIQVKSLSYYYPYFRKFERLRKFKVKFSPLTKTREDKAQVRKKEDYLPSFYTNKTKPIEKSLKNVPVYVLQNGEKDTILLHTIDSGDETLNQKLGLFFFSYRDAMIYLQSILRADPIGSKQSGISIHCIGLDQAYAAMNQLDSMVDFKFIPDLKNLKSFFEKTKTPANIQFYRVKRQNESGNVNSNTHLGGPNFVSRSFLAGFSATSCTSYFKGTPVYIVQYRKKQDFFDSSIFLQYWERYSSQADAPMSASNTVLLDQRHFIDFFTGSGPRMLLSPNDINNMVGPLGQKITNYVFFNIEAAQDFINSNSKKIASFSNSVNFSEFGTIVPKPNILALSLEDLLDMWEKNLSGDKNFSYSNKLFDSRETIFMGSECSSERVKEWEQNSIVNKFKTAMLLKYKKLVYVFDLFVKA
uniref:Tic22 translocator n=1 Tax=Chrysotila carterae TaxID=13221 RepID=UPI0022F332D0|nr:Tic22 translocator [Chrysotila carterae]WAK83197.1 Tic22 translocator [Chrysotila carterae]